MASHDASMNPGEDGWQTAAFKDGLVSIGTHSLYLRVKGPSRKTKSTPVVVTESGLGSSGSWWAAIERLLAPSIRVYSYDRAGLGRSEASPRPRTAENMGSEILELLHAAGVPPPYIWMAHSYGGVIARESLAALQADWPGQDGVSNAVVGMVFVDTNQERTWTITEPPYQSVGACTKGVNQQEATGIMKDHQFAPDELARFIADTSSSAGDAAGSQEAEFMVESSKKLGEKSKLARTVLGSHPVTVIRGNAVRDVDRVIEAARPLNNGTEEQWKDVLAFRDGIQTNDLHLQKEQMLLSKNSRFVQTHNSGHNPHMTEPDLVVQEVLRLFKSLPDNLPIGKNEYQFSADQRERSDCAQPDT